MFRIQDLNPIFSTPLPFFPGTTGQVNSNQILPNNTSGNNQTCHTTNTNVFPAIPSSSAASFANTFSNSVGQHSSNPYTPSFIGSPTANTFPSQQLNNDKALNYTSFYKFCCLNSVNCFFYQVCSPNNGNGNLNAISATYQVLQYEQLIKDKLENDYQIKDVITWIAKKELCVFQLQVDNPSEPFESNVGFQQLKDAMNNIISENNIPLKLSSCSTFDSKKIFRNIHSKTVAAQNSLDNKPYNVVYLSFLRAVHKLILQRLAKSHSLFEASNQSISLDIFPYSGQLMASSMIQRKIVTTIPADFLNTSKKKRILKKLVPYSIIKVNPSLNQKNELIVNFVSLKKIFYKLSDFITISCNNSLSILDGKSNFALYIAPSGIRCLIAGERYSDSITDQPPPNGDVLLDVLKNFNDIDILSCPTLINEKRLWIKLHPSTFNSATGPIIANFLNKIPSNGKKFIYWPLELCFIQFPSDASPGMDMDEPILDHAEFRIDDPLDIVDTFLEIEKSKINSDKDDGQVVQTANNDQTQPEAVMMGTGESKSFKFPESFDFNPGMDHFDQQLKPLKHLTTGEIDGLHDYIKSTGDLDDLFDNKAIDLEISENIAKQSENDFEQQIKHEFEESNENNRSENVIKGDTDPSKDKLDSNVDDDWNDLFGGSVSDVESLENKGELQDYDTVDYEKAMDEAVDSAIDNMELESNSEYGPEASTQPHAKEYSVESVKHAGSGSESSVDAMAPSVKGAISTSPFYKDPGAPSPIPFQIFVPSDAGSFDRTKDMAAANNQVESNMNEPKKSVFAPLNFNPLIQKEIDSKYSDGGKFFVKHNSLDPFELRNPESEQSCSNSSTRRTPLLSTKDSKLEEISTRRQSFLAAPGHNSGLVDLNDDLLSDSDDSDKDDSNILNEKLNDDGHREQDDFLSKVDGKDMYNTYDLLDSTKNDIACDIGMDPVNDGNEISNHSDYSEDFSDELGISPANVQKSITGLGIKMAGVVEGNSAKRRKLETIFDNILEDDDNELDLEFEDNDDNETREDEVRHRSVGFSHPETSSHSENKLVPRLDNSATPLIAFAEPPAETPVIKTVTPLKNIEVPNSWFYVLRMIAPIQVPFNFLGSKDLTIKMFQVVDVLPILQELVLYSQKYMNNTMLNTIVKNRECPSVLDSDVEYLLFKIFPSINKVNVFELLDSNTESMENKPFDSLFENRQNQEQQQEQAHNCQNKLEDNLKPFDDMGLSLFSPVMSNNQTNQIANQLSLVEDTGNKDQDSEINGSIPSHNLFRVDSTKIRMKRANEEIVANKVSLKYWKILNFEPHCKKDFKVIFIVPKVNANFNSSALNFLDNLIDCYNDCKLGEIEKGFETGIVEVDCKMDNMNDYWEEAETQLLQSVESIQSTMAIEGDNKLLLMFLEPFQSIESIIKLAGVSQRFEAAMMEKNISEKSDPLKKKKKKKVKTIVRLPLTLFYKAFSVESFYLNEEGQFIVPTNQEYTQLCFELFNICPRNSRTSLKDRNSMFCIENEIQNEIDFSLAKRSSLKSLVDNETFLHLCYERSVDKKWCVASWITQTGEYNYTKSWYISDQLEGSKNFEEVANDIMSITTDYISTFGKKTFVILTRLSNIIPDDELVEWKRLSSKNNDIMLIVMTAELESSSLIISQNSGPRMVNKRREEASTEVNYTVSSTNSQTQTPANLMASSTMPHQLVSSTKYESPEVSMYTPSFENGLSPIDSMNAHLQMPIQTLQPLMENSAGTDDVPKISTIIDIADECYGLIYEIPQPLSNQPRLPLKTGFLVNTGEGVTNNNILEVNLLSFQAGMDITKFLKRLLVQYRHLGSIAPCLGMTGLVRVCGNVASDDFTEDDDDDDLWDDKNHASNQGVMSNFVSEKLDRKRERQLIQQQYSQFNKMYQRQKRLKMKEREKERRFAGASSEHNIIPVHMLAVRKLLDFLVNINVD